MTLDQFNANPVGGVVQLDATTGAAQFNVGGRLSVGSSQTAGVYSGTFAVSVEYQ